jgi:hypothetical protein
MLVMRSSIEISRDGLPRVAFKWLLAGDEECGGNAMKYLEMTSLFARPKPAYPGLG